MIWEKISELRNRQFDSYSEIINEDEELENILQYVDSIKEYIAIKYSQCILLDSSLNNPLQVDSFRSRFITAAVTDGDRCRSVIVNDLNRVGSILSFR